MSRNRSSLSSVGSSSTGYLSSHFDLGGLRPGTTKGKVERITTGGVDEWRVEKPHPTVRDYYKSQSKLSNSTRADRRPIGYQHGLSNYSSVVLGDDRISYTKSMSQEVFKADRSLASRSKVDKYHMIAGKTKAQRRLDYLEAQELVGEDKIEAMEEDMRDKLNQRTTAGPFQLRKTFKYFDRDGSGGIDLGEFSDAMELMGFQFSEIQILALFARYDVSFTGEVDYHEFVDKLMEWDYGNGHMPHGHKLNKMVSDIFKSGAQGDEQNDDEGNDSDLDQEELEMFRSREIRKIFDMIDKDKSGFIDAEELEILMLALGKRPDSATLADGISKIDNNGDGKLDFDEFLRWYIGGVKEASFKRAE